MILPTLALAASVVCAAPAPQAQRATPIDLQAIYNQGIAFDAFMERARRRRQTWVDNHAKGVVPDDLLARARAVPGAWKLLVVGQDACSDSAATIPYLAHLVAAVDGLDMRIVDPSVGRPVMEAHRTPDGRAATPTMVLLDEDWQEAGCFVERPVVLQEWALDALEELSTRDFVEQKTAWYDEDAGRSTMEAIIELMEEAAVGVRGC